MWVQVLLLGGDPRSTSEGVRREKGKEGANEDYCVNPGSAPLENFGRRCRVSQGWCKGAGVGVPTNRRQVAGGVANSQVGFRGQQRSSEL